MTKKPIYISKDIVIEKSFDGTFDISKCNIFPRSYVFSTSPNDMVENDIKDGISLDNLKKIVQAIEEYENANAAPIVEEDGNAPQPQLISEQTKALLLVEAFNAARSDAKFQIDLANSLTERYYNNLLEIFYKDLTRPLSVTDEAQFNAGFFSEKLSI